MAIPRRLWQAAVAVALVVALLAGAAGWLIGTEAGLHFALERAHAISGGGLTTDNAQGALARRMTFDRLAYASDGTEVEAFGIRVQVRARALLRGNLVLDPVHIDRLVVRLPAEEPQAPQPPGTPAAPDMPADLALPVDLRLGATIGVFEIVRADVTALQLRDVRLDYAGMDQTHRLDALQAETPWGRIGAAGSVAAWRPFPLNVALVLSSDDSALAALRGTVQVHVQGDLRALRATGSARSSAGPMRARAHASLRPLAQAGPAMLESLRLQAQAVDLAALSPALPQTGIAAQVDVQATADGRLAGTLRADNATPGALDQQRLPIASVASRFSADLSTIELQGLAIDLAPGGRLTGSGELRADPLTAQLALRSEALNLRAFNSTLRATALNGPLSIGVQGPRRQNFSGTLTQQGIEFHAAGEREGDRVDLRDLRLAAFGGEVTGSGHLVLGAPARFDASLQVDRFDPSRVGAYPAGSLNGRVTVDGALGEPRRISARWTVADSTLRGQALRSRGSAQLVGTRIAQVDATAALGRNRASVRGAFGAASDRLQWQIDAPSLSQLSGDLLGRLSGRGSVAGSSGSPRISLQADAQSLRLPGDLAVARLQINGDVGLAPDAPLNLKMSARDVRADALNVDTLTIETHGKAAAHRAALQAAAGPHRLAARLRGGWKQSGGPGGTWSGMLQELVVELSLPEDEERVALRLTEPAPLSAARDRVEIDAAAFDIGDGRLRVESLLWQPDRFSSGGRFADLPARWLWALVPRPPQVRTSVQLAGEWSVSAAPRLNGSVSIRHTGGDVRLSGQPAIDAGLDQARLNLQFDDSRVQGTLSVRAAVGSLSAEGTIAPVADAEGLGLTQASPLDFTARLDIADIQRLTDPLQTVARVSGRAAAEVRGSGTLGSPQFNGQLQASEIGVDVPPYGIFLRDGMLRARLEGDTVSIEQLEIRAGSGRLTARGSLPLQATAGTSLTWNAENFRVLDRPDLRLVLSGDGRADMAGDVLAVRGALRVDRGYFESPQRRLPNLGEDVVIVGRPASAPARRTDIPLKIDLQIDLGDDLQVRMLGLSGELTGQVQLQTSEAGELRVYGRVETVDASYRAYGQDLQVDPGVLIFDGPLDNPTLEIRAWRRNQPVEAGVQIAGAAQSPRVSLLSEPQVPEGERLSWLVLGRAPGDAEGADIALLQAAAGALLAGRDAQPLNQRIAGALGLDELALRGSREIESRVVALGKRLADDLYVTYEQGIGAAAEHLVRLDYTLTRRISLRAQTGTATGVGIFYRFAWD
jgi:translocation and assembly module TamB